MKLVFLSCVMKMTIFKLNFQRRGVLEPDEYNEFAQEQPVLAWMTSASVIGLVSVGERAGQRVRRILQDPAEGVKTGHLCFASRGFSLHAARRIAAGNKHGLESLCNSSRLVHDTRQLILRSKMSERDHVARPLLAAGSLQRISDDEYAFKLKTPWSDGTTHLILSPDELIEKLAALVPPSRQNLVSLTHFASQNKLPRSRASRE